MLISGFFRQGILLTYAMISSELWFINQLSYRGGPTYEQKHGHVWPLWFSWMVILFIAQSTSNFHWWSWMSKTPKTIRKKPSNQAFPEMGVSMCIFLDHPHVPLDFSMKQTSHSFGRSNWPIRSWTRPARQDTQDTRRRCPFLLGGVWVSLSD